jgi:hypothetical protein
MLQAQIGLPRIGTLSRSFLDPLIPITAVTAAARARDLLAAARLARSLSATSHEDPRSFLSFAQ